MIDETIREFEARLKRRNALTDETRGELLALLTKLKGEIEHLAVSHEDDARSIAHFVSASTHEATRAERNPTVFKAALNGLTLSVEEFRASHPELTRAVNALSKILMDLGI